MYEILIILFLIIAVAIIALVLIQKGKGADMGSSFGAGASASLFGSAGSGNFLTRTTTILGILFFIISIALANLSSRKVTNPALWNLGDGEPVAEEQVDTDVADEDNATDTQEEQDATSDIPE